MIDRDKSIRERAYEIWEAEGQPEGREQEHWEQASSELNTLEATSSVSEQKPDEIPVQKKAPKPKSTAEEGATAKSDSAMGSEGIAKTERPSLIDRAVAVLGSKPKNPKRMS